VLPFGEQPLDRRAGAAVLPVAPDVGDVQECRALEEQAVRRYVDTGEPLDKAGAYGIQGRAGMFVTRIEGSYSGIMGLPLAETTELMHKFGITVL
jgi:predicted house-cleaning NTP pyrophosphatase (Maf/HAM1 superfamily)